jgi:hypothetical protein
MTLTPSHAFRKRGAGWPNRVENADAEEEVEEGEEGEEAEEAKEAEEAEERKKRSRCFAPDRVGGSSMAAAEKSGQLARVKQRELRQASSRYDRERRAQL